MTGSTAAPAKLKPWQFSLRFLFAVMTLACVVAAFFGWRERRLEPQRRAVAKIIELGGSVTSERHGWFDAIWRGCETEEVVGVSLPGHRADDALPHFKAVRSLRRVVMDYACPVVASELSGDFYTDWYRFTIDGQFVEPSQERPRFLRLQDEMSGIVVAVAHNGNIVPAEEAFVDSKTSMCEQSFAR